jgi:hypothetical protein
MSVRVVAPGVRGNPGALALVGQSSLLGAHEDVVSLEELAVAPQAQTRNLLWIDFLQVADLRHSKALVRNTLAEIAPVATHVVALPEYPVPVGGGGHERILESG